MLIDPDRLPKMAISFMNQDHAEQARRVNAALEQLQAHRDGKVPREQVHAALEALYTHTREHFGREESAMVDASFPAYPNHRAEHERMLAEMGEAERRFRETGQGERLAAYLAEFPTALEQHLASMDATTARYMAEWGG